jgi:hypothetical protein
MDVVGLVIGIILAAIVYFVASLFLPYIVAIRSHWRLTVQLPPDYADQAPAIFKWLRLWLIPALLQAPVEITLAFEPPDVRPDVQDA